MKKTYDSTHRYRGMWRGGGRCRIEVYVPEAGEAERRPVIVASELDENEGSSVTTMAEYLAAEIVARHFPHLLDAPAGAGQPVVWLEQYPPGTGAGGVRPRDIYAVVYSGNMAREDAPAGARHPGLGAARPACGGHRGVVPGPGPLPPIASEASPIIAGGLGSANRPCSPGDDEPVAAVRQSRAQRAGPSTDTRTAYPSGAVRVGALHIVLTPPDPPEQSISTERGHDKTPGNGYTGRREPYGRERTAMTDGRDEHPPPPLLYFPPPPAGPLRTVEPLPLTPATPEAGVPPAVTRPSLPPPARHQLLVTLVDSDPLVWRRLAVPSTITLAKLHRVLQAALGWTDSHLHQFVAGDTTYGDPALLSDDPPQASTRRARLGQVAPAVGAAIQYEYDFGDGWQHLIVVERLLWHASGTKGATCLAGGGACPPEDCGGIGGYADLQATLRRGQGQEYRELLTWLGGPVDPMAFDLAAVNRALRRLR